VVRAWARVATERFVTDQDQPHLTIITIFCSMLGHRKTRLFDLDVIEAVLARVATLPSMGTSDVGQL
jgi:hypothetical protein